MTLKVVIPGPPIPRPQTPEALRSTAHEVLRRSAIYCQVLTLVFPTDEVAIVCDELQTVAEYSETEPNGTRVFLGELANGYEWQVKVGCV